MSLSTLSPLVIPKSLSWVFVSCKLKPHLDGQERSLDSLFRRKSRGPLLPPSPSLDILGRHSKIIYAKEGMHFVTAGGQLERAVEGGTRDRTCACAEAQNRNNLHTFTAALPRRRLAHSPSGNALVPRVGKSNAAGLEGGAEGGAGSVKGSLCRGGGVRARGASRAGAGGWGSGTPLATCHSAAALERSGMCRQGGMWRGGVEAPGFGLWFRREESSLEKARRNRGGCLTPPPRGSGGVAAAGRAQPLAGRSRSRRGTGTAAPEAEPPSCLGLPPPRPGKEKRALRCPPQRPGRVACGLFSQLASVALQTRECLWWVVYFVEVWGGPEGRGGRAAGSGRDYFV